MFTGTAVALPLKKRALRGRRLVLVDIENLVGGAVSTTGQAVQARATVAEAIGLDGTEHVVIGTSHVGVVPTGFGWCGPRLVVRSGEDGADLALLDVLLGERVAARFDEVVLASGDGIFTDAVAALGTAGVDVTVLARSGHCSKRLRLAARHTVLLEGFCADVLLGGAA